MKNQYLTYGSIISVSHVADHNSFITSDGFVKRTVMLRNFVIIKIINYPSTTLILRIWARNLTSSQEPFSTHSFRSSPNSPTPSSSRSSRSLSSQERTTIPKRTNRTRRKFSISSFPQITQMRRPNISPRKSFKNIRLGYLMNSSTILTHLKK